MKKKQIWTIICFALILGISIVGGSLTEKRIAVETASGKIGTSLERPVIVIDAGHGRRLRFYRRSSRKRNKS